MIWLRLSSDSSFPPETAGVWKKAVGPGIFRRSSGVLVSLSVSP